MDRGEHVVLNKLFGNENCVLVVVAFPLHIAYKNIFTESKLAVVCSGAVGDNLARLDFVSRSHNGTLVKAGALVGTFELFKFIFGY